MSVSPGSVDLSVHSSTSEAARAEALKQALSKSGFSEGGPRRKIFTIITDSIKSLRTPAEFTELVTSLQSASSKEADGKHFKPDAFYAHYITTSNGAKYGQQILQILDKAGFSCSRSNRDLALEKSTIKKSTIRKGYYMLITDKFIDKGKSTTLSFCETVIAKLGESAVPGPTEPQAPGAKPASRITVTDLVKCLKLVNEETAGVYNELLIECRIPKHFQSTLEAQDKIKSDDRPKIMGALEGAIKESKNLKEIGAKFEEKLTPVIADTDTRGLCARILTAVVTDLQTKIGLARPAAT